MEEKEMMHFMFLAGTTMEKLVLQHPVTQHQHGMKRKGRQTGRTRRCERPPCKNCNYHNEAVISS